MKASGLSVEEKTSVKIANNEKWKDISTEGEKLGTLGQKGSATLKQVE